MTEQLELDLGVDLAPRARCRVCNRALSNPASVAAGIGPICAGKQAKGAAMEDKHSGITDIRLTEPEFREAIVLKRIDGQVATNVPHAVVHHSPTGYEYGYGGSGPADLALNIAEICVAHLVPNADHKAVDTWDGTGCSYEAWAIHHDLKFQLIGALDQEADYEIPYYHVKKLAQGLLVKHGQRIEEEYALRRELANAWADEDNR